MDFNHLKYSQANLDEERAVPHMILGSLDKAKCHDNSSRKKKIAKLILTTPDNAIVEKIKTLIFPGVKAHEAAVKKYNKEIDKAVKQIKAGKFFTQDEANTLLAECEKK